MSVPRVTVGLPVYNGERYLPATLRSILDQDFADFELLVADNASTDGTLDLVRDASVTDRRIRILTSDENMGAAPNYNRLVRAARGELFKWAGYDDILEPGYLSRCVEALDRNQAAVLAFPSTSIIDGAGNHVGDYDDRLDLRDGRAWMRVARYARRVNLCNACFGVMRRDVMLTTGLIRAYVSSDITFLAEMAVRGQFVQDTERLFRRRVHSGSSRQGHTTLAEVARWFDTSVTSAPKAPRLQLLLGTAAALAATPVPMVHRGLIVGAYTTTYATRRARIRAGRLRAALQGRTVAPSELIHQMEREIA